MPVQMPAKPRPAPHPAVKTAMFVAGVLLIVASPAVGLLPGPGGIFVFAGGLVLVLRTSRWARRRWARFKRRFPRVGDLADRVMRRPSALRRHARAKAAAAPAAAPTTLTCDAAVPKDVTIRPSLLAAFSISTIKE